jgi:uncharacterized protein YlzI (FlbEa/FlbD family)
MITIANGNQYYVTETAEQVLDKIIKSNSAGEKP